MSASAEGKTKEQTEWEALVMRAKRLGLSPDDVRKILAEIKRNNKEEAKMKTIGKTYFNVPTDLYVHKDGLQAMLDGGSAIGFTDLDGCKEDYRLIDKRAIQPVTEEHKLSEQAYDVVFIME